MFRDDIVPIHTQRYTGKGAETSVTDVVVDTDECPRAKTTLEGLTKLRPAFVPTGTVTAGNASPYSDGAAGATLTTQRVHELRRRDGGYGMVTMCIGGGMDAAGIFEGYP